VNVEESVLKNNRRNAARFNEPKAGFDVAGTWVMELTVSPEQVLRVIENKVQAS
jgi:hypothetical protein